MKNLALTLFAFSFALVGFSGGSFTQAQSPVLLNLYGQGVHAYHRGQYKESYDLLSTAINNGLQDPRAYYFRGIVADNQGRQYEAESDWRQGAQLEARGKIIGSVGRALARYQGGRRLVLEKIRAKEKLQYLAEAAIRSQQKLGDPNPFQGDVLPSTPAPRTMVTPPSAPMASDDNPFADENPDEPTIESDDALKDAMNDPFAEEPDAPAGEDSAPADDPFATGDDAAPAVDDPFATDDSDPFATSDDDDPFAN